MSFQQPTGYAFQLGQAVVINVSGEQGTVRARGDGVDRPNQYFVSYCNAQGVATEQWWNEDQLSLD